MCSVGESLSIFLDNEFTVFFFGTRKAATVFLVAWKFHKAMLYCDTLLRQLRRGKGVSCSVPKAGMTSSCWSVIFKQGMKLFD